MSPILTIVTASHCNQPGLQALAAEILPQLDAGLRWFVKDSGACLETRRWAEAVLSSRPGVVFDASPDRGIYDALNQALGQVSTDYYVVVGSDDSVDGPAMTEMARGLVPPAPGVPRADVLTFPVRTESGLWKRKRLRPLWVSSSGLFTTHSVGTVIRRDLHDRIGPYDTAYRILADSLFLRRAWISGAIFEHREAPVLGSFSLNGVSSLHHGRRMVETYTYLVSVGSPKSLQAVLLALRLLRYRPTSLL